MSTSSVPKEDSKTNEEEATEKKSKESNKSDSLVAFSFHGEDSIVEEEEQPPVEEEVQERSTFFNRKYVKPTILDYRRQELRKETLFTEVRTLDKDTDDVIVEQQSFDEPSILVTGFGIRNLESLQDALRRQKRRFDHLCEIGTGEEEGTSRSSVSSKREATPLSRRSSDRETETERSSVKTDMSAQKLQLQYLLGLETEAEEEHIEEPEKVEEEEEDQFVYSTSKSTRAAQKYLRVHRIFDFFQLIIAHLLGAMPDNPIDFIMVFLSKCLCYRSGLGKPPLLYEQKHIEQLYKLMDRMNTGYIEVEQYHQGMATFGICEYNKIPPLSQEGLVAREFFIQEALECETAIFDDLIRRRWIGTVPPTESRAPTISASDSGAFFIPPDLLMKLRPYQLQGMDQIMEEEGEQMGEMG